MIQHKKDESLWRENEKILMRSWNLNMKQKAIIQWKKFLFNKNETTFNNGVDWNSSFSYYENKETFHGSRSVTEIFIYRSIMVIIWIFKFILPMLQHMKRWIMDVEGIWNSHQCFLSNTRPCSHEIHQYNLTNLWRWNVIVTVEQIFWYTTA